MGKFRVFFRNHKLSGQSMRAGGVTALAEAGAVPDLIMGSGRWSSQAWTRYVRRNPVLLHALILARSTDFGGDPVPIFA